MSINDWLRLIHPILAVTVVFPLIGMVTYFATQTRQRRLALQAQEKSKIPPVVGKEHVNLGKILTSAVVGVSLVGLAHPIFKNIVKQSATDSPVPQGTVIFIAVMFLFTIGTLVCLYRSTAPQKLWRGLFAALSTAALWILGSQDGVYRRTHEWQVSHYYYGMVATTLMIISLAILPEIYQSKTWRKVHITLNCIALLLFIGQGITGARDLLEIPLSWQEPFVFGCDYANKTCGG
ncbi:DUF4079 domain-containing protein [Leptothoe sp. PORK10 BA2]|uniref:DUF4079 domain-containing protein n=1 Tax=Leptothoe sp. PORK10 BA2 TaxID=3110254 RepID=UPI002B20B409|nr:DUF4079 domain-containing protein [Leptothoe sp. PORK10 BA2]MEA5463254.1 DUF4079 domain-containing protein [Leptothoe sp. PORK10 BA2]